MKKAANLLSRSPSELSPTYQLVCSLHSCPSFSLPRTPNIALLRTCYLVKEQKVHAYSTNSYHHLPLALALSLSHSCPPRIFENHREAQELKIGDCSFRIISARAALQSYSLINFLQFYHHTYYKFIQVVSASTNIENVRLITIELSQHIRRSVKQFPT